MTEALLKYPIVFLTGLLVAWAVTRLWQAVAVRWGLVDLPGARKIHVAPIPVAGGVAIFVAFHAACAVVFLYPWSPFSGQLAIDWWLRFLPLSVAVLGLGLVDDRFGLAPLTKLLGQVAIAVAAFILGISVQNVLGATWPAYVNFVVTVLWFLLLMNSFNLIDGIDGLAAGIAFIAAIGIAISLVFRSEPGDVLLFLGFAGACLGFLRYNFYPARVFLGDTGSLLIGFTMAALAISTSSKGPTMAAIGVPLLAVGVPLFDTVLAIWRRSVRRWRGDHPEGGVAVADGEHLHHRLLSRLGDQSRVALLLYGGTAALAGIGVLVSIFHDRVTGILALAFILGAYTILRHLAWIELRDSGEAVLKGIALPVRRNQTLLFYVSFDLLILNGALVLIFVGLDSWLGGADTLDVKRAWLRHAPFDVGLPFLFLVLFRSYSRIWYLARISEHVLTGAAVVIGLAIAFAIQLLGAPDRQALGLAVFRYLLLAGVSAPLIVGSRAAMRVVQDAMHWWSRNLHRDDAACEPVLICGTGYRVTLFLREQSYSATNNSWLDVVGIVNDDAATRGHYLHGYRVIGAYSELPALLRVHRIRRIYLVEDVDASAVERILAHAGRHGVEVVRWSVREERLVKDS